MKGRRSCGRQVPARAYRGQNAQVRHLLGREGGGGSLRQALIEGTNKERIQKDKEGMVESHVQSWNSGRLTGRWGRGGGGGGSIQSMARDSSYLGVMGQVQCSARDVQLAVGFHLPVVDSHLRFQLGRPGLGAPGLGGPGLLVPDRRGIRDGEAWHSLCLATARVELAVEDRRLAALQVVVVGLQNRLQAPGDEVIVRDQLRLTRSDQGVSPENGAPDRGECSTETETVREAAELQARIQKITDGMMTLAKHSWTETGTARIGRLQSTCPLM